MKQIWGCLVLSIMILIGGGMTANAADTKIDNVKVVFSYDAEPKSGDEVGKVYAKTESQEFRINYAEYINENDIWSVGDRPIVRVEIVAKDGYRFAYTSKSHFTLSGGGATFKKARFYDDGTVMELEVYLQRIGGQLSEVQGIQWDGTIAEWDELHGSKSYEVRLYRDERSVKTVETSNTFYDFSDSIYQDGFYTFRVRAIASYNNRVGEWSDYSEDFYIDEEDVWYYNQVGRWVQNQYGWWYSYGYGGYPVNCWKNINNAWYYFNNDGYMLTGWQYINNRWYFMETSGAMLTGWRYINNRWYYLDGSGAMLTGWQYINNRWYYLDGNGAMLTGWQYINGRWYYMDGSGAMYANTRTPDGYYVDSTGARVY